MNFSFSSYHLIFLIICIGLQSCKYSKVSNNSLDNSDVILSKLLIGEWQAKKSSYGLNLDIKNDSLIETFQGESTEYKFKKNGECELYFIDYRIYGNYFIKDSFIYEFNLTASDPLDTIKLRILRINNGELFLNHNTEMEENYTYYFERKIPHPTGAGYD